MPNDGVAQVGCPSQYECWWSVADVMNRTQVVANERLTTLPASRSVLAGSSEKNRLNESTFRRRPVQELLRRVSPQMQQV
jgi:hypothetical protein